MSMELAHSIDATKLRRDKSKEAVQLALEGKWREAINVNKDILYYYPEDVESLNRLGKAHLEVGEYPQAKEAFQKALSISPHNTIAKKNVARIAQMPRGVSSAQEGRKVAPKLFLEESGKSGVTSLRSLSSAKVLAAAAAGDPVELQASGNTLCARGKDGQALGHVETKLGTRLMHLMKQGNRYDAAILSVDPGKVSIIIRETYHHPSLMGVQSFPATGSEEYPSYVREAAVSYDIESEPDDEPEADPMSMWTEDGEEAPEPMPRRSSRSKAMSEEEEEEDVEEEEE
ncbi:MAG: tetratricopeptide repeat protein [SAR202 cluster bacterium]|nr:tetratricopeptide repeat protein [SAR202 cluster bacterium]